MSALINELSEIEIDMNNVDAEIIFTPKVHCEIAGRGTEHLWGASKVLFRRKNADLDNDKRVNDLKPRVEKNIVEHVFRYASKMLSKSSRT